MSSRHARKEAARQRRLRLEYEQRRARKRARGVRIAGAGGVAAAIAAIAVIAVGGGKARPAVSRPFVSSGAAASGRTIDGIRCETDERVLVHVHAHLAIFVDGRPRTVPAGIGIAPPRSEQETPDGTFVSSGSCFYWLHSHTDDGVIHIESPRRRTYTLGDYFDIWNQPLGRGRVGAARGPVHAYVDGKRYMGDPRRIELVSHRLIQLDVGSTTAPRGYVFAPGL
jgi:hypothetical protein